MQVALIIGVGSDALKKPTNSWSLVSLFDSRNSLINDNSRIGGVTFNAPTDAGVGPFDLPSVALSKIAQAKGIQSGTKEFTDFMNHTAILTLGPRQVKKSYEVTEKHRHQAIIDDANTLQEKYSGLKVVLVGDGDLMPRVVSALGIDLDGYKMITFGRSGSAEATASLLAAGVAENGQFANTYVSAKATNDNYSREAAYQYKPEEIAAFKELGIPEEQYLRAWSKEDAVKGKGIVAMTAVTGASGDVFGKSFADLLGRVEIATGENEEGVVAANTFVVTSDGSAFVVETQLFTPDFAWTKKSIERASKEAKRHFFLKETLALSFTTTQDVKNALDGIVELTPEGAVKSIIDESALRGELVDKLVYDATFNPDQEVVKLSRKLIRDIAALQGARLNSVYNLFQEKAKDSTHYTVPAINIRGMAYNTARAVFGSAVRNKVDKLILEIAKSEITYTQQRPAEYTTSMLAAAIKEGYKHPVNLQGDHFQISAKDYLNDPIKARDAIKSLIREAVEAGFYQIDLDNSVLVDWSKLTADEQQKNNYKETALMTAYVRTLERELGLDKQGIVVNLGGEIGEIGMGMEKGKEQHRRRSQGIYGWIPR